jgi:HEAT repeat protein
LKISAWNLPVYDNIPALEAKEAEVAIRRIGTNALPYLIRSLTLETPGWKRELQAIGAQGRLFSQEWFSEADHKAGFALKGFEVLGPTASPAIPRLNRLLGDRYSPAVHQRVVMALVHIGKAGIPALVAMLGDRSRPDRRQAALALGRLASEFRTNAGPAVPILVSCMQDKDVELAAQAAITLGELGLDPQISVPALVRGLEHADFKVRIASLECLGVFGRDAQIAVPALSRAFSDPEPFVREVATNAMRRVAPEVLATNRVDHF